MNEGQLTRALAAGNAWWRDSQWERDDRDLRPFTATTLDYEPTPLADIVPDGLYVLRGPRRVGKSLEIEASDLAADPAWSGASQNHPLCLR